MDVDPDNHLERLRAEYQRQRANLADMQRRIAEVSSTATSPRREVSVTVNSSGDVFELKFPTKAYKRLAPNELSELLMTTIAEARRQAGAQTNDLVAPLMPDWLDPKSLENGLLVDVDSLPEDPTTDPAIPSTSRQDADTPPGARDTA